MCVFFFYFLVHRYVSLLELLLLCLLLGVLLRGWCFVGLLLSSRCWCWVVLSGWCCVHVVWFLVSVVAYPELSCDYVGCEDCIFASFTIWVGHRLRAKTIKNVVKVNAMLSAEQLQKMVDRLKRELAAARRYIAALEKEIDWYKANFPEAAVPEVRGCVCLENG